MEWLFGSSSGNQEAKSSEDMPTEVKELQAQVTDAQKKLIEFDLVQKEVEGLKTECESLRVQIEKQSQGTTQGQGGEAADAAEKVKALEKEKETLKEQVTKGVQAASQLEGTRRKSVDLAAELEKEREKGKQATTQTAELRKQLADLKQSHEAAQKEAAQAGLLQKQLADLKQIHEKALKEVEQGKTLAAQLEDAQKQVKALQEQESSLKTEVEVSEKKRRSSVTKMTKSLSEISAKLDNAETSWTPWKEINGVKQDLGTMQKDVEQEATAEAPAAQESKPAQGDDKVK